MGLSVDGKSSLESHAGNVATKLYRWLETMCGSGIGVRLGRASFVSIDRCRDRWAQKLAVFCQVRE
jgi:hypothetical protein